jgi:general secretion pathway protein A
MYNDYFGFRENPFNVTPDPRYFYTNPIYQEAYASLLYGIRERKGFIVLTGEIGTGKTTLLRRLMDNPEENIRLVFFYNTTLTFEELISFACDELGLPVKGSERLQKIQALNEFLISQSKKGGTVVLLVDEAQNLTADVLENLRLLSNLETAKEKLLQIVLVGQTELNVKLSQPQLRQVKQRVALHCRLDRLKESEVGTFINYRMRIAGYEGEELFTPKGIREVAIHSKGIPRLINIISDNALLIAYATSVKKISAEMIKEVVDDLRLDTEGLVRDDDFSKTKTVSKSGKNEKEKRPNVSSAELTSARRRNLTPIMIGSLAVLVLVLLFGGIVFYQPNFDVWLSDNLFNLLKPQKTEVIIEREPARELGGGVAREKSPGASEAQLASANQVKAAPTSNPAANIPEQSERSSSPSLNEAPAEAKMATPVQKSQSVVVPRGRTISQIAAEAYGTDKVFLAMDILKESNPQIEDLNWVLAGQNLSLLPLNRETLIRKQSDGSYYLILDSFLKAPEAENLSKAVRLKGYQTAITARKLSKNLVLQRVEIRGLKSLEGANQAWDSATTNRWVSSGTEAPSNEAR